MYQKLLRFLAQGVTTHYRITLAVCLLITLVLGAFASTLKFNLSFLAILPPDPEIQFFKETTDKFGGSSDLLLVIETNDPEKAIDFAEDLAPRLKKLDKVRSVHYRLNLDFVESYGLLFWETKDLKTLRKNWESHEDHVKNLYSDLRLAPYLKKSQSLVEELSFQYFTQPEKPDLERLHQAVAMAEGGVELSLRYLEEGKVGEQKVRREVLSSLGPEVDQVAQSYLRGGYVLSPQGKVMLLNVRLNLDLIRVPFGVAVYKDIQKITEEVAQKHPRIKATYTGMMAMAHEDQNYTLNRFQWLSFISLILVILLFFYISKLKEGPFLVGLPLLMAMIWTFGLVKIGLGFVSITSMVFAMLLFGLGIDFAIHLMVRFQEEYLRTSKLQESLVTSVVGSGRGIITGGFTTAFAFFAMCLSNYPPAVHLGYTTGWGLICCLLAMMTLFPALIYWIFRNREEKFQTNLSIMSGQNRLLSAWVSQVSRFPRLTILLCLVALAVGSYQIRHLRMEYNLEKIIYQGLPSVEIKDVVRKKFGRTNDYLMVVAKNMEEVRSFTRKLRASRTEEGEPVFARILSLSDFVPTRQEQKLRRQEMAKLHELVKGIKIKKRPTSTSLSPGEIKSLQKRAEEFLLYVQTFKRGLSSRPELVKGIEKLRVKLEELADVLKEPSPKVAERLARGQKIWAEATEKYLDKLEKATRPVNEKGEPKELSPENLPPSLRDRFLSRQGESFLILAYPRNSSYDRENIAALKQTLAEVAPGRGTGMLVLMEKLVTGGLRDFPMIVGAVLLIMLIILSLDFQSPKYLLFTLLPLIFSSFISLGIICYSGATISILMLVAFPLIFGIGIDDGVHVLHRYRESRDIHLAVSQTGKAIFLTTVTTLVSFGSLVFTNHHGLIGTGLLIGLGVALCFVFSVTVLPAALVLWGEKEE